MNKKVLIQFAHPTRSRSRMNKVLLAAVETLDGITINDLYAHYPDFLIDISREQELCESHDIIIFQHPFYWYSTPSIMKEWLDLVLQYGWAYGSKGKALQGKLLLQAITAGGEESTYQRGGYNAFTIQELTSPYQATAKLCGMIGLPPFVVFGIHSGLAEETMLSHAEDYRRSVVALRDGTFNLQEIKKEQYFNGNLHPKIGQS